MDWFCTSNKPNNSLKVENFPPSLLKKYRVLIKISIFKFIKIDKLKGENVTKQKVKYQVKISKDSAILLKTNVNIKLKISNKNWSIILCHRIF